MTMSSSSRSGGLFSTVRSAASPLEGHADLVLAAQRLDQHVDVRLHVVHDQHAALGQVLDGHAIPRFPARAAARRSASRAPSKSYAFTWLANPAKASAPPKRACSRSLSRSRPSIVPASDSASSRDQRSTSPLNAARSTARAPPGGSLGRRRRRLQQRPQRRGQLTERLRQARAERLHARGPDVVADRRLQGARRGVDRAPRRGSPPRP